MHALLPLTETSSSLPDVLTLGQFQKITAAESKQNLLQYCGYKQLSDNRTIRSISSLATCCSNSMTNSLSTSAGVESLAGIRGMDKNKARNTSAEYALRNKNWSKFSLGITCKMMQHLSHVRNSSDTKESVPQVFLPS